MGTIVKIEHGPSGWGGPFTVEKTKDKTVVASITGGGIHPIAQHIADLLGVEAVDAFNNKVAPEDMIIVVIDCGGTARCGVYPKLKVKTLDVLPIGPSGPLARFITEDLFVSGCEKSNIYVVDEAIEPEKELPTTAAMKSALKKTTTETKELTGFVGLINRMGRSIGGVVNTMYQAARDTLDVVLKNIIPFMMFISVIIGIINYTGIGKWLAELVKPLAGSLGGLFALSVFTALPFLSPVLGPGAVIGQMVGVLIGEEIGRGTIPPRFALPALFAINSQVGCDFLPVALTMAEADDETAAVGVPAVLFSRLISGPATTVIAYICSHGLY